VCTHLESIQYPENPIRRDIASEGEDISLLFATGRYRHRQFNLKGSTDSPTTKFLIISFFFSATKTSILLFKVYR
jgi:hypothetical protein